jgi:hypothetical protein
MAAMKRLAAVVLILVASALRAQAPTPAPLARGNAPGEPHHHLKIENEYVRAYYVEVPPHDATQLHQHDHDYIFVALGDSDVTNAVLGKPEVRLQLKDGEVRFTRGGFAHVARNNSDAPFRNVTIEFLRPQGEPRNLCEQIGQAPLGDCRPAHDPQVSIVPLFETGDTRLELLTLAPQASFEMIGRTGRLLVAFDKAELEVRLSGKASSLQLHSGGLLWLSPGDDSTQTVKNLAPTPSRYLTVFVNSSL